MRFLRTLFAYPRTLVGPRRYAHVHDVQIKVIGVVEGADTMQRNVFKQPLALHSTSPMTGFTRTGYCEVPRSDLGNHSVAAVLSEQFLDFSAARGNDLRSMGLAGGCRWCLCVSRWKEAFDARGGDGDGDGDALVPRVVLGATNERALDEVGMEVLRRFEVGGEERLG